MTKPISDERLSALRERTGGWPSNSAECHALIARLDAAEARIAELEGALREPVRSREPGREREIAERLEAATLRLWPVTHALGEGGVELYPEDLDLFTHAPDDIGYLLDKLAAAEARAERYREALREIEVNANEATGRFRDRILRIAAAALTDKETHE